MSQTWVLIGNAARARLCAWDRHKGLLTELADFVHPESRLSGRELGSERSGHAQRSLPDGGAGGATLDTRVDARRKEHRAFAHELSEHLDQAVRAGDCGALVLIAAPPFLGELRAQLKPSSDKLVQAVVGSDLSQLALPDLARRLAEL